MLGYYCVPLFSIIPTLYSKHEAAIMSYQSKIGHMFMWIFLSRPRKSCPSVVFTRHEQSSMCGSHYENTGACSTETVETIYEDSAFLLHQSLLVKHICNEIT